MNKKYKLRLLKDLPEYPKDCVFMFDEETGWRGYWEGGNWGIPQWLEQLLYKNMPEVYDEMQDWFVPIVDEETTVYVVNILGEVKEQSRFNFWSLYQNSAVFDTREEAEKVAGKLKHIFATKPTATQSRKDNND